MDGQVVWNPSLRAMLVEMELWYVRVLAPVSLSLMNAIGAEFSVRTGWVSHKPLRLVRPSMKYVWSIKSVHLFQSPRDLLVCRDDLSPRKIVLFSRIILVHSAIWYVRTKIDRLFMIVVQITGFSAFMERPHLSILFLLRDVVIRVYLWIRKIALQNLHPAFIVFPAQPVLLDPKESQASKVFLVVKALLEVLGSKE